MLYQHGLNLIQGWKILFLFGNKTEVCKCVCVCVSGGSGSQVFWDIFEYISIFKQDRYAWIFFKLGTCKTASLRWERHIVKLLIFCTGLKHMHTRMKGLTLLMLFIGAYFSGRACARDAKAKGGGCNKLGLWCAQVWTGFALRRLLWCRVASGGTCVRLI